MFLLVSADVVRLWTSALFMLVVGMGNAVNMTSQRLMIHDRVGASYGPTAMAVEPLLSGGASMIASFDFVGHAAMFGGARRPCARVCRADVAGAPVRGADGPGGHLRWTGDQAQSDWSRPCRRSPS